MAKSHRSHKIHGLTSLFEMRNYLYKIELVMYEKSNEALNLVFLRLFEELSTLEDEVEKLKNTVPPIDENTDK